MKREIVSKDKTDLAILKSVKQLEVLIYSISNLIFSPFNPHYLSNKTFIFLSYKFEKSIWAQFENIKFLNVSGKIEKLSLSQFIPSMLRDSSDESLTNILIG